MNTLSSQEKFGGEPHDRLDYHLTQNRRQLMAHTQPGVVLSAEQLAGSEDVIAEAERARIGWPTAESGFAESTFKIKRFFVPNPHIADNLFAREALEGKRQTPGRGFNNLYALLVAQPYDPTSETLEDIYTQEDRRSILDITYGSKPYLMRAHLLYPEFMGALREAVNSYDSMPAWNDALIRGANRVASPDDVVMLRSTRLAYGLLVNLMDRTDTMRQKHWFGFEPESGDVIEKPENELWA